MTSTSCSTGQVGLIRAGLLIFASATIGSALGWWNLQHTIGRLPDLCLFHALTGHDCPGCGMGRALACLTRGELRDSLHQHPFAFPIVVWLACWALLPSRCLAPIQRSWLFRANIPAFAAVGVLITWWLVMKVA